MPRLFVFADEAGDFAFSRDPPASRYFILCTVSTHSCDVGNALIELRRKLAWDGAELGDCFHATRDKQAVRDAVFGVLQQHDFQIQATVMEKSKAYERVKESRPRFYQYGWFYHFRHVAPKIIRYDTEVLVTTASLGTHKERRSFTGAVDDVMQQIIPAGKRATNFCPAAADPCLQVADYCAWALQRKWERGDTRSYALISHRITHEYDLWSHGRKHFY